MNILGIDTSTDRLGIAVSTQEGVFECYREIGFRHAEILAPLVQSLLQEAGLSPRELDLLVCSRGPGSFTGLRIGIATVKGLAAGCGAPIVTLPTLNAMAHQLSELPGIVITAIDGKKRRVYARPFRRGEPLCEPMDIRPDELAERLDTLSVSNEDIYLVGSGSPLCIGPIRELYPTRGVIPLPLSSVAVPRALIDLGRPLLEQGEIDAPSQGPLYLRSSEAEETATTKKKC